MHRQRLTLTLVILTGLVAARAEAQIIPGWNTKQFTFDQIDAERVVLVREVEIEGEPGSPNAGQKFFADELHANIKTGEFVAKGNVVFVTPTTQISADSVTFNTRTKLGTFVNANGIASLGNHQVNRSMFGTLEPDVYFYGAEIEKVDTDKYRITKGGFTTCVQPAPRWRIVSGSATVNLDDYIILRNAVVQVKHVPVFYLPVLYYPIQEDDRATGFLLPTYGASTYQGSSISNAFFWAINRSQDATLFHDWFFSRGTGMGAEYRYMLAPSAQGDLRAYWLDEKEALINGVIRPARKSQKISGGLSQGLPLGLSARARVDYFTDVRTQQLYNYDFVNASQSTRTIDGGLTGSWRSVSTSARYQRTEYFPNLASSYVSGTAPGLTVAYTGQKLPFVPVYLGVNAEAARILYLEKGAARTVDNTLDKVDFMPTLRAPLSTVPFLSVNASLAVRSTYFSESLAPDGRTQIEEPVTRNYADMRAEVVGPVFSRVFNPNNAFADRMKHVIEPSVSVQRRTTIDTQNRIPISAGAYDTIVGGSTQVSYALANRLLVRKAAGPDDKPQTGAPRELVNVSLRQSYYTNSRASTFDNSYVYGYANRPPSPYSPISLSAKGAPLDATSVDFRLEYDPTSQAVVRLLGYGLNGTYRTGVVDASVGWNKQFYAPVTPNTSPLAQSYIQQTTQLKLSEGKYGGTVTFHYDIARSTLVNHRYIAFYNAQCCGLSFEYLAYNYTGVTSAILPQNRRFNMSFTLAGVGSFSNFFGAFGGGTYQ